METASLPEVLLQQVRSIRYGVIKNLSMAPFVGLHCSTISTLGLDFKIVYPHCHSYVIINYIIHKIKLNLLGEIRHLHATVEKNSFYN